VHRHDGRPTVHQLGVDGQQTLRGVIVAVAAAAQPGREVHFVVARQSVAAVKVAPRVVMRPHVLMCVATLKCPDVQLVPREVATQLGPHDWRYVAGDTEQVGDNGTRKRHSGAVLPDRHGHAFHQLPQIQIGGLHRLHERIHAAQEASRQRRQLQRALPLAPDAAFDGHRQGSQERLVLASVELERQANRRKPIGVLTRRGVKTAPVSHVRVVPHGHEQHGRALSRPLRVGHAVEIPRVVDRAAEPHELQPSDGEFTWFADVGKRPAAGVGVELLGAGRPTTAGASAASATKLEVVVVRRHVVRHRPPVLGGVIPNDVPVAVVHAEEHDSVTLASKESRGGNAKVGSHLLRFAVLRIPHTMRVVPRHLLQQLIPVHGSGAGVRLATAQRREMHVRREQHRRATKHGGERVDPGARGVYAGTQTYHGVDGAGVHHAARRAPLEAEARAVAAPPRDARQLSHPPIVSAPGDRQLVRPQPPRHRAVHGVQPGVHVGIHAADVARDLLLIGMGHPVFVEHIAQARGRPPRHEHDTLTESLQRFGDGHLRHHHDGHGVPAKCGYRTRRFTGHGGHDARQQLALLDLDEQTGTRHNLVTTHAGDGLLERLFELSRHGRTPPLEVRGTSRFRQHVAGDEQVAIVSHVVLAQHASHIHHAQHGLIIVLGLHAREAAGHGLVLGLTRRPKHLRPVGRRGVFDPDGAVQRALLVQWRPNQRAKPRLRGDALRVQHIACEPSGVAQHV